MVFYLYFIHNELKRGKSVISVKKSCFVQTKKNAFFGNFKLFSDAKPDLFIFWPFLKLSFYGKKCVFAWLLYYLKLPNCQIAVVLAHYVILSVILIFYLLFGYRCPICQFFFPNEEALNIHIKAKHEIDKKCEICNSEQKFTAAGFDQHLLFEHFKHVHDQIKGITFPHNCNR